jgi:hypothetical protein
MFPVMPNKPRADNPTRTMRVEDHLWNELMSLAADDGTDMSKVARDAFTHYVKFRRRQEAAERRRVAPSSAPSVTLSSGDTATFVATLEI